jgi:hypothetical protein
MSQRTTSSGAKCTCARPPEGSGLLGYTRDPRCAQHGDPSLPREQSQIEQVLAAAAQRTTFKVVWGGSTTLTISDCWPDHDGPENPTTEDVIAQMQQERYLETLLDNWNLDVTGVTVDGKPVVFDE